MRAIIGATGGLLVALLFSAAGCKKEATKPIDMTVEVEHYADRACACTDAACASAVIDKFVGFMQANKGAHGDKERTDNAAARLGQCVIHAGMPLEDLKTQMQKLQEMDDK